MSNNKNKEFKNPEDLLLNRLELRSSSGGIKYHDIYSTISKAGKKEISSSLLHIMKNADKYKLFTSSFQSEDSDTVKRLLTMSVPGIVEISFPKLKYGKDLSIKYHIDMFGEIYTDISILYRDMKGDRKFLYKALDSLVYDSVPGFHFALRLKQELEEEVVDKEYVRTLLDILVRTNGLLYRSLVRAVRGKPATFYPNPDYLLFLGKIEKGEIDLSKYHEMFDKSAVKTMARRYGLYDALEKAGLF